jgi:uncharacterized RDD family membrane protein YckC
VPAPDDTAPTTDEGEPQAPTFLRRFGALLVDWALCQLFVVLVLRFDTTVGGVPALAPVGVFALYTTLLVALTGGATLGHRLFGLQVWQVRPGSFLLQAAVRTVLICLVVPAVLTAQDGRSFHDVWAGTRIVRP